MTDTEGLTQCVKSLSLDISPLKLFDIAKSEGRPLYASAPMVRYSKLAFRQTVADYGVDLTWTPMILAKEFNRSQTAHFTTTPCSPPTIAQFGSNSPQELVRATTLIAPFVNGVDLNCGCPQSWACAESLGAALMHKPELVCSMIRASKAALRELGYTEGERTVSVKIRVHKDLRETVDFVRAVEDAGADFITVHGRTRGMASSVPVSLEAMRVVKEVARVPVLGNGDVFEMGDVKEHVRFTGVDGVMAARGILQNPALFGGREACPWEAVERFLGRVVRAPIPFKLVVHHLSEMVGTDHRGGTVGGGVGTLFNKDERKGMMACGNMVELIDFIDGIREVRRL